MPLTGGPEVKCKCKWTQSFDISIRIFKQILVIYCVCQLSQVLMPCDVKERVYSIYHSNLSHLASI